MLLPLFWQLLNLTVEALNKVNRAKWIVVHYVKIVRSSAGIFIWLNRFYFFILYLICMYFQITVTQKSFKMLYKYSDTHIRFSCLRLFPLKMSG